MEIAPAYSEQNDTNQLQSAAHSPEPTGSADSGSPGRFGYVGKHWRGELPLWISFWINFFLLTLLLRLADSWLFFVGPFGGTLFDFATGQIRFLIAQFIIFPWQIVGVWRSCLRRRHGQSKLPVIAAQALVLLATLVTIMNVSKNWWPQSSEGYIYVFTGSPPENIMDLNYFFSFYGKKCILLLPTGLFFGFKISPRSLGCVFCRTRL